MNLKPVIDFTNSAHQEIGKYKIEFILSPGSLMADCYTTDALTWESIRYGEEELEKVPDDKRGIYSFVISKNNEVLPPHGYVLYIGIAGRNSNRTLRERYKDYLDANKVLRRSQIARMIGDWHDVLRFYFAPIDDNMSSNDLEVLEKQLNSALMPPFSEGDLEAEIKKKRKAFRL